MSEAALQSHVRHWLAARPARLACAPFLDAHVASTAHALAALEHEVLDVLASVREPLVADAKLRWWADEMAAVPAGTARHPLTQALAGDAAAVRIAAAQWRRPAECALAAAAATTPADDAAQWEQALAVCAPWAALEAAWWHGPGADSAVAAQAAAVAWRVDDLLRLPEQRERPRLPLSMQCLARHGLARDGLAMDTAARRNAVREQCAALAERAMALLHTKPALAPLRGFDLRLDAASLRQAARSADPLTALARRRGRPGPAAVLAAWRAARAAGVRAVDPGH